MNTSDVSRDILKAYLGFPWKSKKSLGYSRRLEEIRRGAQALETPKAYLGSPWESEKSSGDSRRLGEIRKGSHAFAMGFTRNP